MAVVSLPLRLVAYCALAVWWWRKAGPLERRLMAVQAALAFALGASAASLL